MNAQSDLGVSLVYMFERIAPSKAFFIQNLFSYLSTKTYCGYSLEEPQQSASNEYQLNENLYHSVHRVILYARSSLDCIFCRCAKMFKLL